MQDLLFVESPKTAGQLRQRTSKSYFSSLETYQRRLEMEDFPKPKSRNLLAAYQRLSEMSNSPKTTISILQRKKRWSVSSLCDLRRDPHVARRQDLRRIDKLLLVDPRISLAAKKFIGVLASAPAKFPLYRRLPKKLARNYFNTCSLPSSLLELATKPFGVISAHTFVVGISRGVTFYFLTHMLFACSKNL